MRRWIRNIIRRWRARRNRTRKIRKFFRTYDRNYEALKNGREL